VIFSIFNSKNDGRRRGLNSVEIWCVALYATVFVLLIAGCLLAPQSLFRRFRPLATEVSSPPPSPAWHLGYFNGDIEHAAVYNNLFGAADAARRADVLFVGNSRIQYAFRDQDTLRRFFSAQGLSYFILAFGYGEGSRFTEAIVRRFDLHPKWVVVNADPFFGKPFTTVASQAVSFGYPGAWKTSFETETSLAIQRRVHRIVPYIALSQWDFYTQWIYYRAKSDGTLRLSAWRGKPGGMWQDDINGGRRLTPGQLAAAESFKRDLSARGARLVLTWIPPSASDNARQLSSVLRVPLIAPDDRGLTTIDGSHLDERSSKQFSARFLDDFARIVDQARR